MPTTEWKEINTKLEMKKETPFHLEICPSFIKDVLSLIVCNLQQNMQEYSTKSSNETPIMGKAFVRPERSSEKNSVKSKETFSRYKGHINAAADTLSRRKRIRNSVKNHPCSVFFSAGG